MMTTDHGRGGVCVRACATGGNSLCARGSPSTRIGIRACSLAIATFAHYWLHDPCSLRALVAAGSPARGARDTPVLTPRLPQRRTRLPRPRSVDGTGHGHGSGLSAGTCGGRHHHRGARSFSPSIAGHAPAPTHPGVGPSFADAPGDGANVDVGPDAMASRGVRGF